MSALVFGHMNPDCDSIMSSLAAADLLTKRGMDAVACAQGAPTPDSEFVLKQFGLTAPQVISEVAGKDVVLVDFSDLAQGPKGLAEANILGIFDHHKLGDVTTNAPLEAWIWPAGCTGTVLKAVYDFYGIEIPKGIAGGLMCAILSDTVLFKSPTCTDADKKAVEALAKICGADYQKVGMDMLKVKSSIDGIPAKDLVFRDYKDFDMNGKKVGIGQVELIDLSMADGIKGDLKAELAKVKAERGCHSVFLLLTDIMKEGSEMLIDSDDPSVVEKAFGKKPANDVVWLDGVMSRKKQVVPPFQAAFK